MRVYGANALKKCMLAKRTQNNVMISKGGRFSVDDERCAQSDSAKRTLKRNAALIGTLHGVVLSNFFLWPSVWIAALAGLKWASSLFPRCIFSG